MERQDVSDEEEGTQSKERERQEVLAPVEWWGGPPDEAASVPSPEGSSGTAVKIPGGEHLKQRSPRVERH